MKSVLNHIAILVNDIDYIVKKKNFSSDLLGEIEEFPSEGTRELYIGKNDQMGRLLLMQAVGEGPYKRALEKRGPSLHHIALDVLNIDDFLNHIANSGWSLHPRSIYFYNNFKQIYLSRIGIPALIEVKERKNLKDKDYFIERLEFPFREDRYLEKLSCGHLKMSEEILITLKNDSFGKELWI